jgi:hypothetical protein
MQDIRADTCVHGGSRRISGRGVLGEEDDVIDPELT